MGIEIPEGFKADTETTYTGHGEDAVLHVTPIITYNGEEVWRSPTTRHVRLYSGDADDLEDDVRREAEDHLINRLRGLFA